MRFTIGLILLCVIWMQGVKPLVADYWQAKAEWKKALAWNPGDSMIQLKLGNLPKVIETNNGDLTQYSLWFRLAIEMAKAQNKQGVIYGLDRALWYYPGYEAAKRLREALNARNSATPGSQVRSQESDHDSAF